MRRWIVQWRTRKRRERRPVAACRPKPPLLLWRPPSPKSPVDTCRGRSLVSPIVIRRLRRVSPPAQLRVFPDGGSHLGVLFRSPTCPFILRQSIPFNARKHFRGPSRCGKLTISQRALTSLPPLLAVPWFTVIFQTFLISGVYFVHRLSILHAIGVMDSCKSDLQAGEGRWGVFKFHDSSLRPSTELWSSEPSVLMFVYGLMMGGMRHVNFG